MNKEMIENFIDYLCENEKCQNTIIKYQRDLYVFFEFLNERSLEKKIVREYKNFLMKKYAPRSVNSMLTALNSFFDYIERRDLKVKVLRIQKKIFINENKNLTKNEYKRLLHAAHDDVRLQLIMETLCSTGMRVSELQYITVENYKSGEIEVFNKGKERTIFLSKKLIQKMKIYIQQKKIKKGKIFVTKTGKPMDRISIWRCMKQLCQKAQVQSSKVFPHNLRRLFARSYYSLKKDLSKLADLLGHTSIETTRIYIMEDSKKHYRDIEDMNLII